VERLRLIVIDDSAVYRKVVSDVLNGITDVEVVAVAPNGKIGLEKIERLKPDVVTLDVEMPEMDGIETLRNLKKRNISCEVVMLSSFTTEGAEATVEALELGALDFITKPEGTGLLDNSKIIEQQLKPLLSCIFTKRMLCKAKEYKPIRKVETPVPANNPAKVSIVVIGISTGGPNALLKVIPKLPKNFSLPIVVIQHMPKNFTASLAESLNKKSAVNVLEAENGQQLESGNVYVAPGGKQMKVSLSGSRGFLTVTDDPPENNCKPSVDYFFRSVAKEYRNKALGIIMTGMGSDGVLGLRLMKRRGVRVIAQSEETCVVFGMPGEAFKAGVVDSLVPLDRIANEIIRVG